MRRIVLCAVALASASLAACAPAPVGPPPPGVIAIPTASMVYPPPADSQAAVNQLDAASSQIFTFSLPYANNAVTIAGSPDGTKPIEVKSPLAGVSVDGAQSVAGDALFGGCPNFFRTVKASIDPITLTLGAGTHTVEAAYLRSGGCFNQAWEGPYSLGPVYIIGVKLVSIGPSPATDYVAMGDSYSSGEGNSPFYAGTNTNGNACHRSPKAYGPIVASTSTDTNNFYFTACSGAKVSDLNTVESGETQSQLHGLSIVGSTTRLVSLTIGGNDLGSPTGLDEGGLARVLGLCANPLTNCASALDAEVRANLGRLESGAGVVPSLGAVYQLIASRAPQAKLVVLGYPLLYGRHSCDGGLGIDVAEQIWLDSMGALLNDAIEREVDEAKSFGVNAEFVSPEDAFMDHGTCSPEPWIYKIRFTKNANSDYISTGSFHPNVAGQQRLASLVDEHA